MLHQPLLHDHAADGVPNQNGTGRAGLDQKLLQGAGKSRNAYGRKWRRTAIPRHIPCERTISIAEHLALTTPRARRAAVAVQQHERGLFRKSGILIAESAIAGSQAHRGGDAGLRWSMA